MKKNGFTLIELLAVIVILAIIALIATPIILGIINDARRESQERSIELYATAVKNGIALSQLNTGLSTKAGSYTSNTLPFEVEYSGDIDCETIEIYEDGTLYIEGCTVNQEKVEYTYGKIKACTLEDLDKDGKASLSDIVTCGSESFYVMTNENNKIAMLAMYNLDVGNVVTIKWNDGNSYDIISNEPIENPTNKQNVLAKGWLSKNSTWYGVLGFSNEDYWGPNYKTEDYPIWVYNENADIIYPYVTEYERILKEEFKVSSAQTSLINYEQIVGLGCDSEIRTCGPDRGAGALENPAPEWVYATSYWTGFAYGTEMMHVVNSGGTFGNAPHDNTHLGIRPVVTISTSEIK